MTATAFAPLPHETEPTPSIKVFDQLAPDARWGIGHDRPRLRLVADGPAVGAEHARSVVASQSLEVYRRRRFLALVAATLLVLAGAQLGGISVLSFAPAASAAIDESAPTVVVVQPGDSYGAIAAKLGVDEPARFAERLLVANGGAELVVGQRLVIDLDSLD